MVGCVGKAVRWLAEKFLDLNLANRWARGDDFLVIKGLVSWFFRKFEEFWVIYEIILHLLTETYAVYFVDEAFLEEIEFKFELGWTRKILMNEKNILSFW